MVFTWSKGDGGGDDIPLMDLLKFTVGFHATDLRDRVFALCGLATGLERPKYQYAGNRRLAIAEQQCDHYAISDGTMQPSHS